LAAASVGERSHSVTGAPSPKLDISSDESSDRAAADSGSGTAAPKDFRFVFPDFLPKADFGKRHPIAERLERLDMLRRREHIEIPEFYVGSVMAVTVADRFAPGRTNRFVGICIQREEVGLRHSIILRNVVGGLGFEVKYDIYNPLIQLIEVLRLEKRVDEHLLYLRDALPEYSTFPFDMEPVPHPLGAPVPLNTLKVEMKPKPWHQRWELKRDLRGMADFTGLLHETLDILRMSRVPNQWWQRFDLMRIYRGETVAAEQQRIFQHMVEAEHQTLLASKQRGRRRRWLFTYTHKHKRPGPTA